MFDLFQILQLLIINKGSYKMLHNHATQMENMIVKYAHSSNFEAVMYIGNC